MQLSGPFRTPLRCKQFSDPHGNSYNLAARHRMPMAQLLAPSRIEAGRRMGYENCTGMFGTSVRGACVQSVPGWWMVREDTAIMSNTATVFARRAMAVGI